MPIPMPKYDGYELEILQGLTSMQEHLFSGAVFNRCFTKRKIFHTKIG